jgi:hypothetical protein
MCADGVACPVCCTLKAEWSEVEEDVWKFDLTKDNSLASNFFLKTARPGSYLRAICC